MHWALYKEHLEQEFNNPYKTPNKPGIDEAYNKISDQLLKVAKHTLLWKETGASQSCKYTATENKIHKIRKLFAKLKALHAQEATVEEIKRCSNDLYKLFPDLSWCPLYPANSKEYMGAMHKAYNKVLSTLYTIRKKEEPRKNPGRNQK